MWRPILRSIWRPKWRSEGQEPDYRFTLANERTFLAWVRTAMALLAGGLVFAQFAEHLGPRVLIVTLALGLVALSAVLCVVAYLHWRDNEIAMRHGQPMPPTLAVPLLGGAVLIAALAIVDLIVFNG